MYKYEYENVSYNLASYGLFTGNVYNVDDYKSIIEARAKDSWRYVDYILTKQRGTGHVQELDLIFERKDK